MLVQKKISQSSSKKEPARIVEFFNDSSFSLFRKYCKKEKIYFVEDLIDFNIDSLIDEPYFGIHKISKIKKRLNEYSKFQRNILEAKTNSQKDEILQHLQSKLVSEEFLIHLPIFSNIPIELDQQDLHSSYKVNNSIIELSLSIRARNVLKEMEINTIGDLLFQLPSKLLKTRNCGKTTINDIQEKIKEFYSKKTISSINFTEILSQFKVSKKQRSIICDYIAINDNSLPTLKKVGEKYNLTRERVRQIIQKLSTSHDMLPDFKIPLDLLHEKFKGPILFSDIENDINSLLDWDEGINAHSYIRFWSIITNQFKIDRKKNLFWHIDDVCVNCENCKVFINSSINNKGKVNLNDIEENCKHIHCSIASSKLLNPGIIIHFSDEQDENRTLERELKKVKLKFDFDYKKLLELTEIETNEISRYLLSQLQKKEGSISSIRLNSLSRIKKTDFKTVIFELNSQFRDLYSKEFLFCDKEIWEVNPFFNHPENWKRKNKPELNEGLDSDTQDNHPEWLLEQAEKLKDIFKHTVTSYKFYWFKALLTLVKRREDEATFTKMAALMVSHAWKDVLIENRTYTKKDQIPFIVRKIYLDSHLQPSDSKESIISYLLDNLNKYDALFTKLLTMVPYRFISVYIENLHNLKDHQKNNIIESYSKKQKLIYKIEKSKIYINKNWKKYLLNNFDDLKKLISKFIKCEEK